MSRPWWIDRAAPLMRGDAGVSLALGALWHLRERLQFVRENVEPALLALDLAGSHEAREAWGGFEAREREVEVALRAAVDMCASDVRDGSLAPAAFRAGWQALGYARNAEGAGTPADDWLDGLLQLSRLDPFLPPAPFALLNLATRAERIADFLAITEPKPHDVVFDLGSGSGKLALTVAASTFTRVQGVECEGRYVAHARGAAAGLGLANATFEQADVRDVELSSGSVFYLYYPFRGPVAAAVAARLGALARQKELTIWASGPALAFGEFFLAQVDAGALTLTGRRGEFGEVLHLQSARG